MNLRFCLILCAIVITCESCIMHTSITKKQDPISTEFLASLKTNKIYTFDLKNKSRLKVRITDLSDNRITGELLALNDQKTNEPFSSSFDEMQTNVQTIRTNKFNPYITLATLGFIILLSSQTFLWGY
jgi:hypothetical protein